MTREDRLTIEATAFRTYNELETAIRTNGYVPTLSHNRPAQAELGVVLESAGHRVFWTE